jgi:hypothetical protein
MYSFICVKKRKRKRKASYAHCEPGDEEARRPAKIMNQGLMKTPPRGL